MSSPLLPGGSRPSWTSSAGTPAAGRQIPALDGLRALAIAAVLADHGGVAGLAGGFLGVDLFFVLSGFLITSLLLAELDRSGRIDLAAFWTRRARRLLPAVVVLVVVVGFARSLFPDDAVAGLRLDSLAALAWVANWRFEAARTDYFAQGGTPSPLQHTWSLGVEEQYYLIWPVVLVAVAVGLRLLARRTALVGSGDRGPTATPMAGAVRRRRVVGLVAGIGAAASAVAAVVLTGHGALGRVYFGTDTRAQALLIGALTASLLAPRWGGPAGGRSGGGGADGRAASAGRNRAAATRPGGGRAATAGRLLMLGGFTALAIALTRATGTVGEFHGGLLTGVAIAAAAVIAGVLLDPDGPLTRALAARPLVGLGRISYGVYLWHWPVFLVLDGARTGVTGLALFGIRCAVTLAVALASWVLIERPTRRWRPVPSRILPAVACAVLVAGGIILAAVPAGAPAATSSSLAPGVPDPALPGSPPPGRASSAGGPVAGSGPGLPAGTFATAPVAGATAPTTAHTQQRAAPAAPGKSAAGRTPTTAAARRDPHRPLRVDVFGDSIAWTLMRYLPATPGMTFLDHTALGCGIVQGGPYRYFGDLTDQRSVCDGWPHTWATQLAADRPDMVLLLVGRWETMDRVHDGQWMHLGEPAFDGYLTGEIGEAVRVLRSTGAQLVVATEPYNRRGEQADGTLYPEDDPARVDRWNALLRAGASAAGVQVLDLHAKLSPDGRYTQDVDGLRVRSDGVHLTPAGVAWLTPWLVDALRTAAR